MSIFTRRNACLAGLALFSVLNSTGRAMDRQQQRRRMERIEDSLLATCRILAEVSTQQRQLLLQASRREQGNGEPVMADHPFLPFYTGDGGGQLTVCGRRKQCTLGADKHPGYEART
jgi:hypothetical protein